MGFNGNPDGFAPNMPCKDCKTRTPVCHGICNLYQKWTIEQKKFSKKVKVIRKQTGNGIGWYQTKGNIHGKRGF